MTEPVREPINIDPTVKERLNRLLNRPEIQRGLGFSAFIENAIRDAEILLIECNDDGDDYCMTHQSAYQTDTQCEAQATFYTDLALSMQFQAERDGERARA